MRHTPRMRTRISPYHRHRFPAEIISHSVWLYFRFALSFRDVEEILAMRGVVLTYETVREWCLKFGQTYANNLRRRSPRPGDKWHLDEVFLKILCCRPHLIFYVAKIVMWHLALIHGSLWAYGQLRRHITNGILWPALAASQPRSFAHSTLSPLTVSRFGRVDPFVMWRKNG